MLGSMRLISQAIGSAANICPGRSIFEKLNPRNGIYIDYLPCEKEGWELFYFRKF